MLFIVLYKYAKSQIIFSESKGLSIQQLIILALIIQLGSGLVRIWSKFKLDLKQAFTLLEHCAFMTFIRVLGFTVIPGSLLFIKIKRSKYQVLK